MVRPPRLTKPPGNPWSNVLHSDRGPDPILTGIGLVRQPSIPAARYFSRSPFIALAVKAIIGTCNPVDFSPCQISPLSPQHSYQASSKSLIPGWYRHTSGWWSCQPARMVSRRCPACLLAMPIPVSETVKRNRHKIVFLTATSAFRATSPSSVNLIAFPIGLTTT